MANEEYLAFDPADHPTLGDIYDRSKTSSPRDRVFFREGFLAQGAEANEAASIEARKRTNIGNLIARDGDRVKGCDIVVDKDAETLTLAAGQVYVRGDVRSVDEATLSSVTMTGDVVVGVRLSSTIVTSDDDASLLGLHAGTLAEGEPGAVREVLGLSWGWSGDGETGDLYQVYQLRDGFVVDQVAPPALTGFNQAISVYDYDAHENYIARGCKVTALGLSSGKQWFSIQEGTANILGFKRTRNTATRYGETETPDLLSIVSEPHTFDSSGSSATIALNRSPINAVTQVIITKEATETVVRGGVAGTSDLLSNSGVTSITEVVQGGTTYVATTDYVRSGDRVDWSPGGDEPATSSSYDVTYQYLVVVTPDEVTSTTITVSDGIEDGAVFVSYSYKLPRYDRVCLNSEGQIVYLKGVPALEQPQAPASPATLLSLCLVKNDWFGTPVVVNDGVKSYPFWLIDRMYNRLVDALDLIALDRLQQNISEREPTAKKGVFVDPLDSDRYRDAGESQTGAVFSGTFQIAIDPTFKEFALDNPQTLNFTEEAVVIQDAVTGCTKINPYQAFSPLPAKMKISPAEDFWVETQETWLSPATQVFGQGSQSRVTGTETLTSTRSEAAYYLRQISVSFTITGFGSGETLDELLFDGVDVTPAGPLTADGDGVVSGTFAIPPNVTAGTKEVSATGGSGAFASSSFTGRGRIETTTRQNLTNVQRFDEPEPRRPSVDHIINFGTLNNLYGFLPDPVAQSFQFTEGRHISSVDVKFCAIGDTSEPVLCEIVAMDNGFPTTDIIAQSETDMTSAIVGGWHKFTFNPPVFVPSGQETAFVLKTNDPDHSVSFASRGQFDAAKQEWVGAQPYTVGVRFSSSNATTWTAHQDEDLTFRLNCALFDPNSKTLTAGTVAVTDMSDFIVEAQVFLPTGDTRIVFEVEPTGEDAVRIDPGQVWERQSFFTGNVTVRAILTGTSKVSPVMGRDVLGIIGKMKASGTYVSRAFDFGTSIRLDAIAKTRLPAGSTLAVEYDAADDNWITLPQTVATALADGTLERTFSASGITETEGRIKLTLTGTPAARPSISDLRAFSL